MRSFSNPRLHGVLLVAAGAVAGSLGTLGLQQWAGLSPGKPVVEAAGGRGAASDHRIRLDQILAANDREHKKNDLRRLGREAAARDRDTAMKLAASIRDQADRAEFMRGMRDGVADRETEVAGLRRQGRDAADRDAAAALREAEGIKGNMDRAEFTKGIVESMADRDAKAAAEFALSQIGKGALQGEALRISLGKWGAEHPRDAYAWANEKLNGPVKEEAINSIVSNWASRSPEAAARWFEETGSTSQSLLTSLIGGWAKTPEDARAAAGWVETLPGSENREAGRLIAAGELAKQDPAAAAAAYPDPAPSLAGVLADIWGSSDPAAAAKWIQQLPPGQGREQAAGTLASVWAASDINAAAAWSASLADPTVRGAAVEHVATTWGAIDPDKAVAWLDTQPADLRTRGYSGAYNSWAGTDPEGLADWIPQLPASEQADIARRSLAEVRLASDPGAALDLTLGMSPATQPDAAGRFFRSWRRTDDAAAQEWLQANWNSLPAATQAQIAKEQQR